MTVKKIFLFIGFICAGTFLSGSLINGANKRGKSTNTQHPNSNKKLLKKQNKRDAQKKEKKLQKSLTKCAPVYERLMDFITLDESNGSSYKLTAFMEKLKYQDSKVSADQFNVLTSLIHEASKNKEKVPVLNFNAALQVANKIVSINKEATSNPNSYSEIAVLLKNYDPLEEVYTYIESEKELVNELLSNQEVLSAYPLLGSIIEKCRPGNTQNPLESEQGLLPKPLRKILIKNQNVELTKLEINSFLSDIQKQLEVFYNLQVNYDWEKHEFPLDHSVRIMADNDKEKILTFKTILSGRNRDSFSSGETLNFAKKILLFEQPNRQKSLNDKNLLSIQKFLITKNFRIPLLTLAEYCIKQNVAILKSPCFTLKLDAQNLVANLTPPQLMLYYGIVPLIQKYYTLIPWNKIIMFQKINGSSRDNPTLTVYPIQLAIRGAFLLIKSGVKANILNFYVELIKKSTLAFQQTNNPTLSYFTVPYSMTKENIPVTTGALLDIALNNSGDTWGISSLFTVANRNDTFPSLEAALLIKTLIDFGINPYEKNITTPSVSLGKKYSFCEYFASQLKLHNKTSLNKIQQKSIKRIIKALKKAISNLNDTEKQDAEELFSAINIPNNDDKKPQTIAPIMLQENPPLITTSIKNKDVPKTEKVEQKTEIIEFLQAQASTIVPHNETQKPTVPNAKFVENPVQQDNKLIDHHVQPLDEIDQKKTDQKDQKHTTVLTAKETPLLHWIGIGGITTLSILIFWYFYRINTNLKKTSILEQKNELIDTVLANPVNRLQAPLQSFPHFL